MVDYRCHRLRQSTVAFFFFSNSTVEYRVRRDMYGPRPEVFLDLNINRPRYLPTPLPCWSNSGTRLRHFWIVSKENYIPAQIYYHNHISGGIVVFGWIQFECSVRFVLCSFCLCFEFNVYKILCDNRVF